MLLELLWRGKRTIALVFTLVTGAATLVTLTAAPLYEAESSLVVLIGREYAYRPETGRPDAVRTPSLAEMVNSEVEILGSRDLAEKVVRQMGVAVLYPTLLELEPDPELALERGVLAFRAAIDVRPVLESSVIKVSFAHTDPRIAADAVNLLVEGFRDKHVEVLGEEDAGRFEAELEERTQELERAERALAAFRRENGISDLAQQRSLLLGRRAGLEQDLHLCEQELAALRLAPEALAYGAGEPQDEPCTELELPPGLTLDMRGELVRQHYALQRELRALVPMASDALVEQASLRALDLELEERRLLRDYPESSRQVQAVRAERAAVRAFLADPERSAGDHGQEREARARALEAESARLEEEIVLLDRVEMQRRAAAQRERERVLTLRQEDLRARRGELDGELAGLEGHALDLQRLERAQRAAEAVVATYSERAEAARIDAKLDRERLISLRVIERAAPPLLATGLPRGLKLALGALLGLLAGVGSVAVLDLFRVRA